MIYLFLKVYSRVCNCSAKVLCDGQEQCLLNMGSFLIGHEVLRRFMISQFCAWQVGPDFKLNIEYYYNANFGFQFAGQQSILSTLAC